MPYPIFWLLTTLLQIYTFIILIYVVLSWLVAFNVVNRYNAFVRAVIQGTAILVEPALRPIKRILPPLGGFDLSPLVLMLIVWFAIVTIEWIYRSVGF